MSSSGKSFLIVFSLLALLNVIFVPIHDVWGGLFPDNVNYNFADVMELVSEGETDMWVVQLTLSIFVPTLFMFLVSFSGHRGLFLTTTIIGMLVWFKQIVDYCNQFDIETLMDFEDGNVSIGTWLAFGLYLVCFFGALGSKKQAVTQTEPDPSLPPSAPSQPPYTPPASDDVGPASDGNCPNCGEKAEDNAAFCGRCGHKL